MSFASSSFLAGTYAVAGLATLLMAVPVDRAGRAAFVLFAPWLSRAEVAARAAAAEADTSGRPPLPFLLRVRNADAKVRARLVERGALLIWTIPASPICSAAARAAS